MSFDVYLQRFEGGQVAAAPADWLGVIGPLIVERGDGWARLRTEDGVADVYGVGESTSGLMINHMSGEAVWDVVFEVARAGHLAVMPVGYPTCILTPDSRADLPPELASEAVVVRSGADIRRVVNAN